MYCICFVKYKIAYFPWLDVFQVTMLELYFDSTKHKRAESFVLKDNISSISCMLENY